MVKVKICGITNIKDAQNAVKMGADALGFVFAKSPRHICPQTACRIINKLPVFISTVGVFANAKKGEVLKVLKTCKLDVLQFHGQETDKYCAFFKKYCKIIKAFRIKDYSTLDKIHTYKNIDACLFDTYEKGIYGGTGKSFDWNLLKKLKFKKAIIVSGGLCPHNIKDVLRIIKPYAVDISSGIEQRPGKKSANKMKTFIQLAKKKRGHDGK